jgi:hypothetical protein
MDGNTSDKTTLRAFLAKIEKQYGAAKRTWVMDRGIPTEEVLAEMRASPTPIHYLVGTPRGRLTKLEKALAAKSWENVRESVRVKLIEKALAPGLTAKAVLEKLAAIQMIDVELPTNDNRTVVLSRHTEPENDHLLLLQRLKLELPPQPPPKITAAPIWPPERSPPCSADLWTRAPAISTRSPHRFSPVGEVGLEQR